MILNKGSLNEPKMDTIILAGFPSQLILKKYFKRIYQNGLKDSCKKTEERALMEAENRRSRGSVGAVTPPSPSPFCVLNPFCAQFVCIVHPEDKLCLLSSPNFRPRPSLSHP